MAVIGVTMGYRNTDENYLGINNSYLSVIKAAGGLPILLPPHIEEDQIFQLKKKIDGIMLTGGTDVHPGFYQESPESGLRRVDPARDNLEVNLLNWALKKKIPVVALCRGIQVLNIVCGGTIYQDMETEIQHEQNAPGRFANHKVKFSENSFFEKIYGSRELIVNSFHHQAINNPGEKIEIEGKAEDGAIEAVVLKDHPFAVGVQWHPEQMYESNPVQLNLFQKFIKICNKN